MTMVIMAGHITSAGAQSSHAPARADAAGLPFSAADIGWFLIAGVALLALATAVSAGPRRRRRATTASLSEPGSAS
jgi:hypothetical protein